MQDYILKLFNSKKLDYADARLETTNSTYLSIENGELDINKNLFEGIGIRILNKGSWGFASINSKDKKSIEKVFNKAYRLSKIKLKEKIKLKRYQSKNYNQRKNEYEADMETWAKKLKKYEKLLKHKKVEFTNITLINKNSRRKFVNSEGTKLAQNDIYSYGGPKVVAKDGTIIQSWVEREGKLGNFESLKNLETNCKKSKNKVLDLLKAKPSPKGKNTVIMDPHMVGVFAHEAIGHATEADIVNRGGSILKSKIGKKLGSEDVNIIDTPETKNGFGNIKYDDEGVKARKIDLIKNGILQGYMNNRETAEKLGLKLTGNARATSYNYIPIVRMRNTLFMPGKYTKNEIFDIKDGIYVKGMKGGQVQTLNGVFMFAAKEAYRIENGEIKEQLRDVSLNSDILTTLHNIEAIGKDLDTEGVGFCGKDGQSIRAGDGGPHIRARDLLVG